MYICSESFAFVEIFRQGKYENLFFPACYTVCGGSSRRFDLTSPAINVNLHRDPCSLTIHFLRSWTIARVACPPRCRFASAKEITRKKSFERTCAVVFSVYIVGFCSDPHPRLSRNDRRNQSLLLSFYELDSARD